MCEDECKVCATEDEQEIKPFKACMRLGWEKGLQDLILNLQKRRLNQGVGQEKHKARDTNKEQRQ